MINQDPEIYYKRHLPHYQPVNAVYFITFRLADSLPGEVVKRLKQEREDKLKFVTRLDNEIDREAQLNNLHKIYFKKFDDLLDGSSTGPKWLEQPEIAENVKEALHYRDQKVYDLFAYTLMPNHVHLVFDVGRFAESTGRNSVSTYKLETNQWNENVSNQQ